MHLLANRFWPFGRSDETETKATPETIALSLGDSIGSNIDIATADSSLQYYANNTSQNSIVAACLRELSTSISAIELVAVEENERGEHEEYYGPLADIIKKPNDHQSQADFLIEMTNHYFVFGNVYIYLERGKGRGGPNAPVRSLHLLNPLNVTIKAGRGANAVDGVASYEYGGEAGSKGVTIQPQDIAHLKYSENITTGDKVGHLYSLSPMAIIKNDVVMDELLSDLGMNFVKRGAVPSGILHVSRLVSSSDDADAIRRRWKSTFSGKQGQFNVGILDAETKYETLQALPKDLALQETRDEVVTRICSVLGVPPIIIGTNVGLRRSTYSNYKQAMISYRDETVGPLMNIFVRFLNRTVRPLYSDTAYIEPDFDNAAAWQENEDLKAKRNIDLFNSGITTINEARAAMGYDSIDGGDVRRSPANVFEVGAGDDRPVAIAEPNSEKLLAVPASKALEPSAEAQSPPVREPRTGPVPIPRAQELIAGLRRENQEEIEALAKQLRAKYFKPIQSRISGYVGRRLGDTETVYTKEFPFKVEDLVPAGMRNELQGVLTRTAIKVVKKTFKYLADSGIVPTAEYNERGRFTQRAIQQAAANADNIQRTTVKGVQDAITFGLERGYTMDQLANGVPDDGFKGLRGLVKSADVNRVPMIARTEIMQMTNMATLSYYEEMGADMVQIIDGDQFDERCAARNGKIVTLAEAATEEEHPNGIMDFVPAIDRDEDVDALIARLSRPTQEIKTTEEIRT